MADEKEKLAAKKEKEAAKKAKEKERLAALKAKTKEKREKEKAKAAEQKAKDKEKKAKEKEKAKAEKEKAKNLPPVWVEQVNEKGEMEQVDKNKYPFEINCECGNVRYVNKSGLLQATQCKLCAAKGRRKKASAKRKAKMVKYRDIVKDALAKGLFPDDFKKAYGLE